MVRDGIYYAVAFTAAGALVGYLAGPWFALPLLLLGAFCAYFFRDPDRLAPAGNFAVSPADGKVVAIVDEGGRTRVSIFLNVFDVHVNRSPISGVIEEVRYSKGKFLVASLESASAENEQNTVVVRGSDGTAVTFKQIAGLIARRIIFDKKPGDVVEAGERVGLIKFGSRVDVVFGPEWQLEVRPGMRVSAGSSILASRGDRIETLKLVTAPLEVEEGLVCQT